MRSVPEESGPPQTVSLWGWARTPRGVRRPPDASLTTPIEANEQVVRHTGLDVTVDASDRRRASGYLSRQGPPTLRWALFEAAMNASHRRSPDSECRERQGCAVQKT